MNASVSSRFASFGGPCVAHGIAGCAFCLGNAPVRPTLGATIAALLDALPLEDAWDDARADLLLVKLRTSPSTDAEDRTRVRQLIQFHVAAKPEPWRVRVLELAAEVDGHA